MEYVRIKYFLNACEKFMGGKYGEADAAISELLSQLAASKELTELFTAVTQGFDYAKARNHYLRFPAHPGAAHGVMYLPSDRMELLAFVFCLLVELDAGTLKLDDFLLRYFYVDGSYTASFLVFTDRVIRPFTEIVEGCYRTKLSGISASPAQNGENLRETMVKQNYVFRGRIINVRCDDAVLPDGKPCKREVVEHPGGACVLVVADGYVALVRQFRYAYGEELWEIPAGKLERGEDPMLAAKRELEEETGLVAESLALRFTMYPTPGYCNEKIYIYEAKNVGRGQTHPDEDEFLDLAFLPIEEAYAMIEDGRIRDAKTIIALQHYKLHQGQSSLT